MKWVVDTEDYYQGVNMEIKTLEDVAWYIDWLFDYRGFLSGSCDFEEKDFTY